MKLGEALIRKQHMINEISSYRERMEAESKLCKEMYPDTYKSMTYQKYNDYAIWLDSYIVAFTELSERIVKTYETLQVPYGSQVLPYATAKANKESRDVLLGAFLVHLDPLCVTDSTQTTIQHNISEVLTELNDFTLAIEAAEWATDLVVE